MTAKSETVGVDSVWLRPVEAGTDDEAWFVCNRVDPGAVEFFPESALAEKEQERAEQWRLRREAQGSLFAAQAACASLRHELTTLLSGLEGAGWGVGARVVGRLSDRHRED
jgi:hypothetical protein